MFFIGSSLNTQRLYIFLTFYQNIISYIHICAAFSISTRGNTGRAWSAALMHCRNAAVYFPACGLPIRTMSVDVIIFIVFKELNAIIDFGMFPRINQHFV